MTARIKLNDLIGKTFGMLTVIDGERRVYRKNGKTALYVYCQCECGNKSWVSWNSIVSEKTKSCGCYQKQKSTESSRKYNKYVIKDNIVIVSSDKVEFIVDLGDLEKIKDFYWNITSNGYIGTKTGGGLTLLHRFLLDLSSEDKCYVDHIDRNTKNNKRENLRLASPQENVRNGKKRSNNTSGVIGVNWFKRDKVWHSNIVINGKNIHLGYYSDFKEAVVSRLNAEKSYFKEFAPQKNLFEEYGI